MWKKLTSKQEKFKLPQQQQYWMSSLWSEWERSKGDGGDKDPRNLCCQLVSEFMLISLSPNFETVSLPPRLEARDLFTGAYRYEAKIMKIAFLN